jgi:tetratricopeptide (TPR) repeat protein
MRYFAKSLVILTVMGFILADARGQSAEDHFRKGERLIELNCAECLGASKQGLKQGVAEIKRAIETGYKDKAYAYKLLADAYNTLVIVYARYDPKENRIYHDFRQRAYEKAIQLGPRDPKIRYEYAMTLEDAAGQISTLRDVVRLDPNFSDAHLALGAILVQEGRLDEGVAEMKNAIRLADTKQAKDYAERLIDVLNQHGRKEEAKKVREESERAKQREK